MKNHTKKNSKIIVLYLMLISIFSFTLNIQGISSEKSNIKNNKPVKRALLIGVTGYSRGSNTNTEWEDLGTEKDVSGLAELLGSPQHQFRFDEIKILNTKETTTRENILDVIKSFLINQTKQGDVVFLHFSGHGSQVSDNGRKPGNLKIGDEFDELDETLVPSDYVSRADGTNDIRDDEIEILIKEIQKKKPANITMSFDSCFSGTISRGGNSIIRGGSRKSANSKGFGKNESPSGLLTRQETGTVDNSLVILSAARYDQSANGTTQNGGVFSNALINALRKADRNTTYRDIHDAIVSDVISKGFLFQYPQIEGNPNQKLLSNTLVKVDPSFNLSVGKNNEVILHSGYLMGVSENSTFDIYDQGKDFQNGTPIFKNIKVVNVKAFESRLVLQPEIQQTEKLKTARAFKTSHNFGDMRLKVSAYNLEAKAVTELENLGSNNILVSTDRKADIPNQKDPAIEKDSDLRICQGKCSNEINSQNVLPGKFFTVQRMTDGSVIERLSETDFKRDNIFQLLENEARWRFFSKLEAGDSKLNIKIRMVAVECTKMGSPFCEETRDLDKNSIFSNGGSAILREDMRVTFDVLNLSDEDIYLSIISTNEFGELSPLYPHYGYQIGISGENRFSPKKNEQGEPVWQRIPLPFLLRITKPFGNETYRAIATHRHTDFTSILTRDGETNSPLGDLIKTLRNPDGILRSDKIKAKPITNVELDPNEWGIYSIPFTSVKK